MSDLSRRKFLEDSMLATAAAAMVGTAGKAIAEDEKQSSSPNERLSVACVGVRGQGNSHLQAYASRKDTEVTYVVDADEEVGQERAAEIEKKQGRRPKYVRDLREMLDDKSVDCVTTATPNHWHALVSIWAMQAGKDVYVEKPVSHNVLEGRSMVEAARKYNRICQTGTQCRSMQGMRDFMAYIHEGKLGEVKLARGLCYKSRGSIGPKGNYQPPSSVDYDLWTGPAEKQPLSRKNLHYDWHWVWNTGNGDLGNQGIHQMDLARWALQLDRLSDRVLSYGGRFGYEDAGETANTQVIAHDYGDKSLIFEVRGLKTDDLKGARVGLIVYGSEGYAVSPSYNGGSIFDKDGKVVKEFNKGGDHHGNFIKAVRSRDNKDLHADILEGHLSSALCHTGNISYLLGQEMSAKDAQQRLKSTDSKDDVQETFDRFAKHLEANDVKLEKTGLRFGEQLEFDSKSEKFRNNSQADEMLTRNYRAPFVVPTPDKV